MYFELTNNITILNSTGKSQSARVPQIISYISDIESGYGFTVMFLIGHFENFKDDKILTVI